MIILASILIFLIPVVGIVSGLSTAVTIPIFLIILLISLRNKITIPSFLLQHKEELLFAFWSFLGCLWAINPLASLLTYLKLSLILFVGFIVNNYADRIKNTDRERVKFFLQLGVITAISLFFIEYLSNGVLSRSFRSIMQLSSHQKFNLYMLDRGCALLSVISWVVIGELTSRKKYVQTFLLMALTLLLLLKSDSLASLLAFILGAMTFIMSRALTGFFLLISIAIISGSILMPIFAYNVQPLKSNSQYDSYLPNSTKHRLFIWNFVSHKILDNPVQGIGFDSSRYVKIAEDQLINYQENLWSPLPLHPHNNIMQIIFETGVVGLILFLTLVYKYLKKIHTATFKHGDWYKSAAYACFVNYYIISMISYNVWQSWWIYTAVLTATLVNLLFHQTSFRAHLQEEMLTEPRKNSL